MMLSAWWGSVIKPTAIVGMRLVVQYAAQITVKVKVDDALFKQISQHFDTTGVVELTTAIATYNMVARFLTALQITPEGEQAR
jgi:alkylhydroperoxidase family enzyme